MVRSQSLLQDSQRPLIERFGFHVFALVPIENCQFIQACSYIRMVRSQGFLPDSQRPLAERFGFHVFALIRVESHQIIQAVGHMGMVRPEGLFRDRQLRVGAVDQREDRGGPADDLGVGVVERLDQGRGLWPDVVFWFL